MVKVPGNDLFRSCISREAELEEDNELFVGPPPPAMVAEAETANEAERFEEVRSIYTWYFQHHRKKEDMPYVELVFNPLPPGVG